MLDDSDETFPCPNCGEEIYDDSEQCPYCREYLSQVSTKKPIPTWVLIIIVLTILSFVGPTLLTLIGFF